MQDKLSEFLDILSEYLAARKGLLPLLGLGMIILNLIFQFIPNLGFISEANLFLHLGAIISIFGLLLARAL